MTNHFQRRHPGKEVAYSESSRPPIESDAARSLEYSPQKTTPKRQRPTEEPKEKARTIAVTPVVPDASKLPISPLRSPSVSISLGSSPASMIETFLSMPDLFEPPRKVARSETADTPVSGTLPTCSSSSTVEPSDISKADDCSALSDLPASSTPACDDQSESLPAVAATPSVVPFPSPSSYVLHTCQPSTPEETSLGLANDPRLFFAGAPSALRNDFVACLMRQANREARASQNRTISWIPAGVGAITRVEELSFTDGRKYRLKTTLVPPPEYTLTRESSTQTSSSASEEHPKKDASTQVTARQTFTLE